MSRQRQKIIAEMKRQQVVMERAILEPPLVQAGDRRLLIRGRPLRVDGRVLSEGQYRALVDLARVEVIR